MRQGILGLSPLGVAHRSGASVLFWDNYVGSDGQLLVGRTPPIDVVGGGYVPGINTWSVASNEAKQIGGLQRGHIVANVGQSDAVASVDTKTGTADLHGLVLRWTNTSNYIAAYIDSSAMELRIFTFISGSLVVRAATPITFSPNTWYTVSATMSGQLITATLNGGNPITYSTSFNQTATRHGMLARTLTTRHDNFMVVAL